MVCNMLAVVTATLDAKYGVELLASEPGIRALAAQLARLLGAQPRIEQAADYAILYGPKARVVIRPDGIQVQASRLDLTAAQVDQLSKTAVEVAQALAVPLIQERLVATVKAKYGQLAVLSDTRQGAARVTRIRIPL